MCRLWGLHRDLTPSPQHRPASGRPCNHDPVSPRRYCRGQSAAGVVGQHHHTTKQHRQVVVGGARQTRRPWCGLVFLVLRKCRGIGYYGRAIHSSYHSQHAETTEMNPSENSQTALNELMVINQILTQRCINLAIEKQTLQSILSEKEKIEKEKQNDKTEPIKD